MKSIAIVVQRYGDQVVGGAEAHARELAQTLVKELGWSVDVLTTCAQDHMTWENIFPEETFILRGVRVRRFRSTCGRSLFFPLYSRFVTPLLKRMRRFSWFDPLTRLLEWLWVILQGPVNRNLAKHLETHKDSYDRVIFFTYLYLPTLWGVRIVGERSILIPTAHDEPPFHFLICRDMLQRVPLILANCNSERNLLSEKVSNPDKIHIVGLGIHMPTKLISATRQNRYILYLGRLSRGKGVDGLVRNFIRFVNETKSDYRLVLGGKLDPGFVLQRHPCIDYLGFVDEDKKAELIRGAMCIVNPSPLESLSLIVLEAITHERPVLVNTICPVLRDYTDTCASVFGYDDEKSFVKALDHILRSSWDDAEIIQKLQASKNWVEAQYSWTKVLKDFEELV